MLGMVSFEGAKELKTKFHLAREKGKLHKIVEKITQYQS